MTVMLSSQGIGLITVIAVSGCSVMLLVLGRQKLLEAKKEVNNPKDRDCALGSLSCVDSLKTFSFLPGSKDGGSISWRINFDVSEASQESLPKSACKKALSKPSPEKGGNPVKRVRFSDDVVEPSGNNAEYRRRHALPSKSQHAQNSQTMISETTNCSEKKKSPEKGKCRMPPNRRALYNGIVQDRAKRALFY